MEIIILIIGSFGLYFLPSLIGMSKRNAGAIFVLNFFLGWTFIGWVVAMVWACTYDSRQAYVQAPYNKPTSLSSVDQIMKLTTLREKGAISEVEYLREKEKILNS